MILIWIVLICAGLSAETVAASVAGKIADSLLFGRHNLNASRHELQILYSADEQADLYIYRYQPTGFVVLSADDRAVPILAYSRDASLSLADLPPAVEWILEEYQNGMATLRQSSKAQRDPSWDTLQRDDFSQYELDRNVAPMITSSWHQGYPYNYACPASGTGPGGHTPSGCVALAMAQVMRYWGHPTTGQGSHSYTLPGIGYVYANFGGTTYNWGNMPNTVYSVNSDIATLIYHCGVAVNTVYAPDGSGAYLMHAVNALESSFRYHPSAEYLAASTFGSTVWAGKLRTDLNAGRPILYRGQSANGAHAWIIDGYQSNTHFHCNWGWGGSANGYFYLNDLSPDTYNFTQMQEAILGLYPIYQGNLEGVVTTGTVPISQAEVMIAGRTCLSGDDGSYSFSGINIGSYSLSVRKDGYYQQTLDAVISANSTTTLDINLSEPLYPPENLQATLQSGDVHLSWDTPVPPIVVENLSWGSTEYGGAYGYGSPTSFDVAQRWDDADLNQYYQGNLTRVMIYPCYADCAYTIKVWSGGNAINPGTLVYSQELTNPVINEWNIVTVPQPIPFTESGGIWIGYGISTQGGFPVGYDTGPAVDNKGNMICIAGSWSSMLYYGTQFDFNWLIQATVSYTDRSGEDILSHTGDLERDLIGYRLWRFLEGQEETPAAWLSISPETVTGNTFVDPGFSALPSQTYKWAVRAEYTSTATSPAALSNPLLQGVIAPMSPLVSIATVVGGVRISWPPVQTDVHGSPISRVQYRVYAHDEPDFPSDSAHLIGTTRDSHFVHSGGSERMFYTVRAYTSP